jgi:hypothetical protein
MTTLYLFIRSNPFVLSPYVYAIRMLFVTLIQMKPVQNNALKQKDGVRLLKCLFNYVYYVILSR